MSATQNAADPKIQIEMEWTGKSGKSYRSFRIWQNEGWSRSFMQVLTESGWKTQH
jgi:hypothetical protein